MVKLIGIVLIIIGVLGLTMGGFSFMKRKVVLDAGNVEITKQSRQSVPISPIVGVIALIGGVVLVSTNRRR